MSEDIATQFAAMKSALQEILADMRKTQSAITDLLRKPPRESVVEEELRRRIAANEREHGTVLARSRELIDQNRKLLEELQHLQHLRRAEEGNH